MKNVFLALLLANLLFLGWRLWVAPPEVPATELIGRGPEPDIAATTPRRAARAGDDVAAGTVSTELRCLRIGPMADGQLADSLRSSLAGRGIPATATSEEGQIWVGHWVQLESVASRQEADAIAARLAESGLPDAYVLQTSPPFSISLGVFRDRQRADKVAAEASRLGFKPQMTDRYRAGLQYWLAVQVPAGKALSVEDLARESGQILRAEPMACPPG